MRGGHSVLGYDLLKALSFCASFFFNHLRILEFHGHGKQHLSNWDAEPSNRASPVRGKGKDIVPIVGICTDFNIVDMLAIESAGSWLRTPRYSLSVCKHHVDTSCFNLYDSKLYIGGIIA